MMTNDGIKERTTSARKQCPAFVWFVCSSSFQRNKKEIGEHPPPTFGYQPKSKFIQGIRVAVDQTKKKKKKSNRNDRNYKSERFTENFVLFCFFAGRIKRWRGGGGRGYFFYKKKNK
jgi:hypothetical protein